MSNNGENNECELLLNQIILFKASFFLFISTLITSYKSALSISECMMLLKIDQIKTFPL